MLQAAAKIDWTLVQPEIAKITRICTYDVAGTAWSDPGPNLTCPDRVREIHTLLQNAHIEGSYVFTRFSVGALIARFYTKRYPGEVSGMVVVDHAFTPKPTALLPPPPTTADSPPALLELTPFQLSTEDTSDFSKLPQPIRELHRWAASRKPAVDHATTADDCESRLNATTTLSEIPLVVISTGNTAPGLSGVAIPPGKPFPPQQSSHRRSKLSFRRDRPTRHRRTSHPNHDQSSAKQIPLKG